MNVVNYCLSTYLYSCLLRNEPNCLWDVVPRATQHEVLHVWDTRVSILASDSHT